ncbi:Hypothetical_protein [Hexamita inflata]|uniref:Hypothetical_protein n=1 Tax=Hexamita inflata TaxID=28002 RepID=A0AA86QCI5_9EUKA|nr:Hypothetical protein HINF_LOCUS38227 [Hexamita inflata]CAI9959550.1 Hypothetical protein HINF_LOCUS47195 [Hexamita inflata]
MNESINQSLERISSNIAQLMSVVQKQQQQIQFLMNERQKQNQKQNLAQKAFKKPEPQVKNNPILINQEQISRSSTSLNEFQKARMAQSCFNIIQSKYDLNSLLVSGISEQMVFQTLQQNKQQIIFDTTTTKSLDQSLLKFAYKFSSQINICQLLLKNSSQDTLETIKKQLEIFLGIV